MAIAVRFRALVSASALLAVAGLLSAVPTQAHAQTTSSAQPTDVQRLPLIKGTSACHNLPEGGLEGRQLGTVTLRTYAPVEAQDVTSDGTPIGPGKVTAKLTSSSLKRGDYELRLDEASQDAAGNITGCGGFRTVFSVHKRCQPVKATVRGQFWTGGHLVVVHVVRLRDGAEIGTTVYAAVIVPAAPSPDVDPSNS